MYMDAVREIRALEEELEQAKARSRAQAQEVLDATERDGHDLLAETRRSIREADEASAAATEEQAARRREEILAVADADCQTLRARAAGHMDAAVALLVGKVVGR